MSKYADIEQIKEVIRTEWVKYMPMELDVSLSFVLGKIAEVPTIEVSEDCISREWLEKNAEEFGGYYENTVYAFPLSKLDDAPSVVPSRAKGEWIYIDEPIVGNPYGRYRCSECEMEKPHKTDYCPNCGAKMKGADDD